MQALAAPLPTLRDAALPASGVPGRAVEALAFSALISLGAQLELRLPFTPVPITGQTFGVLLAGLLLGPRWGTLSAALYVMEGASGLPVFAGGAAGAAHLVGPSGGYLAAFAPAAWLTGRLAGRGWDRSAPAAAAALLCGSAVILAGGLLNLARFVPLSQLLAAGLWPFLPGDAVKAALGAAVLPWAWRRLGRR
ncbi:MAG: biotin transporter BioY [Elusimicrobia bacterium]|nr:biotin transporter BioY [Elusimicrobiota bacterium]